MGNKADQLASQLVGLFFHPSQMVLLFAQHQHNVKNRKDADDASIRVRPTQDGERLSKIAKRRSRHRRTKLSSPSSSFRTRSRSSA